MNDGRVPRPTCRCQSPSRQIPCHDTGEGREALERAIGALQPREAVAQNATGEELAELLLDEARQTVSVAAARGLLWHRLLILYPLPE